MSAKTKRVVIYRHKSVSLSDHERQVVEELAARLSLKFSSALRVIIREWEDDRSERTAPARVGRALKRLWFN